MTFAIGRRFLIVDGVERWKDADVTETVVPALAAIDDQTTVAFFAREDGRVKAPAKLADAVKQAGGDIATENALKAKDLPRWLVAEATKLGVELDGAAARALVGHVGERQQRLLRELEKLALEHGAGGDRIKLGVEEVEAVAADSAERQVWGLVDAVVARDRTTATKRFLELRAQGEALPRLIPSMARRVREVLTIAARLQEGESPAQVKSSTKGNPWAVDQRIKEARNADPDALRAALIALSDLELDTRGQSELAEDTSALRAIAAMTG
jgi:DNA polymerase-3 subunit delta